MTKRTSPLVSTLRRLAGRSAAAWIGLWALLEGAALGARGLLPPDETRYAAVAWEMWARREFLVPYLNGHPYSDKPPLLFWLIDLGWATFGVHAWWARLVPALFALGSLALTAILARRLWPGRPRVERRAPLLLLGCAVWTFFSTVLMFDMLLVFFVLLALLGVERVSRSRRLVDWLWPAAALGLGVLAKGPVIYLVVVPVVLLAPWWSELEGGRELGGWILGASAAFLAGAGIALAWALPAVAAGSGGYGEAILLQQTTGRVVDAFSHARPFWWYLPLLPVLLFPFSVWRPAWRALGNRFVARGDRGTRFCWSWIVPAFLALSAVSGKQVHYLLPLLPALALLLAAGLDDEATVPARAGARGLQAGLVAIGAVLGATPWVSRAFPTLLPSWTRALSWLPGILLILLAFALPPLLARLDASGLGVAVAMSVALFLALDLTLWLHPPESFDVAPFARRLARLERAGRPIATYGPYQYQGQFHFAARLTGAFDLVFPGQAERWYRSHPCGRVVATLRGAPPAELGAELVAHPYRGKRVGLFGRPDLCQSGERR